MAKKVIFECPSCFAESIRLKSEVAGSRLLTCGECGATMELDLGPPPGPIDAPLQKRTSDDPPPPTERSERSTPAPPTTEADLDEPEEPAASEGAAREPVAKRAPPKHIAKTMPMHVSLPSAPKPERPAAKPAAGIPPLVLLLVGTLCAGGGWLARALTVDPPAAPQHAEEQGANQQSATGASIDIAAVEAYCDTNRAAASAADMCDHLLDTPAPSTAE